MYSTSGKNVSICLIFLWLGEPLKKLNPVRKDGDYFFVFSEGRMRIEGQASHGWRWLWAWRVLASEEDVPWMARPTRPVSGSESALADERGRTNPPRGAIFTFDHKRAVHWTALLFCIVAYDILQNILILKLIPYPHWHLFHNILWVYFLSK